MGAGRTQKIGGWRGQLDSRQAMRCDSVDERSSKSANRFLLVREVEIIGFKQLSIDEGGT